MTLNTKPGARTFAVLVVDDLESNRRMLGRVFRAERFEVHDVESGESALQFLSEGEADLVLLDLHMPGIDGLETLRRIKASNPRMPVVILTGGGDVASAVEAMKIGAFDFLIRPVHNDHLVLTARRALEHRQLTDEVEGLRGLVGGPLAKLMGSSEVISRLAEQIARVAETNVTVLVLGETGTGKELVARALHAHSTRRDGPFVALDCGAIPENLVESELFGHEKGAFSGADRRREGHLQLAHGGTLLLDEVGNLSGANQTKLLRVLQERKVLPIGAAKEIDIDVRFIAATSEGSEGLGSKTGFREDLYHRLAEFVIRLPPLRERPEDIEALARRFLDEACTEFRRPVVGFDRDAAALLREHPWPGNVRELRNAVRQAVLRCPGREIRAADIDLRRPVEVPDTPDAPPRARGQAMGSLKEIANAAASIAEKQAITEALRVANGNKSEAARLLKTDFKTLHEKMKRLGLARAGAPEA